VVDGVPWIGFELAGLLNRVGVQPSAKYVAFETLVRPRRCRASNRPILEWPYREGLRLDEAMHPLTILATGLYGEPMPNQNGAPIRLVVPWKYGFKSIKSIVKISLVAEQPQDDMEHAAAVGIRLLFQREPDGGSPALVAGIGAAHRGGAFRRAGQDTLMFNGYEEQVASLYAGMDLTANY
jgi:methionine sulfoxide reductase catalytic subunit